jgi:hypothetical protein
MKRQAEPWAGTLWETVPRRALRRTRCVLTLYGCDPHGHQSCCRNLAREVEPNLLEGKQSDLVLCCGRAAIGPTHAQNVRQVAAIAQPFWKRQTLLEAAIDERGPRRGDCSKARVHSAAELRALRAPWQCGASPMELRRALRPAWISCQVLLQPSS